MTRRVVKKRRKLSYYKLRKKREKRRAWMSYQKKQLRKIKRILGRMKVEAAL